ncbi:MAG TPA: TonB family protein [Steroidobacteraceae bacterium]
MWGSRLAILASVSILASRSPLAIAQDNSGAPAADDLRPAQLAWGSDPVKRCPELRESSAEEGAVAVVKFMVGPTGAPSQASVRSSSGSAGFDAAAVRCVLRLHFLPVTRYGDGTAVESWQQTALKWTGAVRVSQSPRCEASAGTASAENPAVVTAAPADMPKGNQPGPTMARAGICVCVDEVGKITQPPVLTNSSGMPQFDKAALELSAAAPYRPATAANGQSAAGCFRFKVGIDAK